MKDSINKYQYIKLLLTKWYTDNYAPLMIYWQTLPCPYLVYLAILECGYRQRATILEIFTSQEEVDKRLTLYLLHCSRNASLSRKLIIRSSDTIFLILFAKYCQICSFCYRCCDNNRCISNVKSIFAHPTPEVFGVCVFSFHAITGCNSISAFVGNSTTDI